MKIQQENYNRNISELQLIIFITMIPRLLTVMVMVMVTVTVMIRSSPISCSVLLSLHSQATATEVLENPT